MYFFHGNPVCRYVMQSSEEPETMKCPGFRQLIDYADGRLGPDETALLASHQAAGCADCAETLEWYRLVRATAARDELVTPPAWVLNRAHRIFEQKVQRGNIAQRIAHGIATLVFDSLARPAMAGVRSTEATNRQLLFKSGDYSIDLRIIQADQDACDVIGQLLKESDPDFGSVAGLKVEFVRGETALSAATDEIGEFRINGVVRGRYDMRIEVLEGGLDVPDLSVGEY
jgi:hypothetical protein